MPSVCASMIARVRGPIAASSCVDVDVVGRRARRRRTPGTSPFCTIGLTVVGKPAATVITSSPGCSRRSPSFGEVSAETASRFADEPELHSSACRTPTAVGELALELARRTGRWSARSRATRRRGAAARRRRRPGPNRHRRLAGHERPRGERRRRGTRATSSRICCAQARPPSRQSRRRSSSVRRLAEVAPGTRRSSRRDPRRDRCVGRQPSTARARARRGTWSRISPHACVEDDRLERRFAHARSRIAATSSSTVSGDSSLKLNASPASPAVADAPRRGAGSASPTSLDVDVVAHEACRRCGCTGRSPRRSERIVPGTIRLQFRSPPP